MSNKLSHANEGSERILEVGGAIPTKKEVDRVSCRVITCLDLRVIVRDDGNLTKKRLEIL